MEDGKTGRPGIRRVGNGWLSSVMGRKGDYRGWEVGSRLRTRGLADERVRK